MNKQLRDSDSICDDNATSYGISTVLSGGSVLFSYLFLYLGRIGQCSVLRWYSESYHLSNTDKLDD
jgi:hypothetical protein